MATFEEKVEKMCQNLETPGVILVGGTADGSFKYQKAIGQRSLKNPSEYDPLSIDATMWLASCTKLMTTVAAMQCVEKGQFGLDDDVTGLLPELKGRKILTGFEEGSGEPILVENTKVITLRHLLTHQSGLGYDVFNPTLMQYRKTQNRTPGMSASFSSHTVISANDFPLLFAPGEAWEYSVGIDFAGVMVERANNTDLESYLQTRVWGPLGMKNMTFHPIDHPEVMAKLTDMSERSGGVDPVFGVALDPNGKVKYTADTVWNLKTKDCHGGAGGYGPPVEYYKLLHSLLTNDGKVLRKETVDEMFKPQLTSAARASLAAKMAFPAVNETFGGFPTGVEADWGIGGIMNLQAFPGRSEGSLAWGGYPNLSWWVDRKAGWAGIQGSQICPPGDVKTNRLFKEWVVEMQRRAGSKGRL